MRQSSAQLIEDHLALAEVIALDYANIPGISHEEARSEAHLALLRAARAFDPERGELTAYASRAIRNALNSLYAKQLRIARMFPVSLDAPPRAVARGPGSSAHSPGDTPDPDPKQDVLTQIRSRETHTVLGQVLPLLSPRERVVIEGIRHGNSLSEIGATLGISKQAVHKSVHSGLAKLKQGLERLGYRGIASDGQLRSHNQMSEPPG